MWTAPTWSDHPKTRDLVAVHARFYDNAPGVGHLVVARPVAGLSTRD
jgi:hypothetical protein